MTASILSQKVINLNESASLKAAALAHKLISEGRKIINFSIGEPDFNTPNAPSLEAIKAITMGKTHYSNPQGNLDLRESICEKLQRDNALDYGTDEIIVGSGGKHIIYHAFLATINSDDEVIVPSPYWVSYPDIAALCGGKPIIVQPNPKSLKLEAEELEKNITVKTKWVVLNSPSNPTGAVYTEDELQAIAEVLRKQPHVLILSDEIYEKFVYPPAKHLSLVNVAPDLKERTLIINGASKGYAMTGWRIGFGAGSATLVAAIKKLISQTTTCPSSISQEAAKVAFSETQPSIMMRDSFKERRDQAVTILSASELLGDIRKPEGAFYLFLNLDNVIGKQTATGKVLSIDDDVVEFLLEEANVSTVSGSAYGFSPCLRISFACSIEEITQGCQAIVDALASLKG
ncbi:pyridoxal phosphate-dependent aminotransferase [Marinomonas sp.]|nr:pyridoxal phosphate-dependent aminotransferase [Marinomonas sp.]MDB4837520.1 pyridoxal phosphate-dependent aminotransferase [Marinomonas sp.]